jgi:hypothetical protein
MVTPDGTWGKIAILQNAVFRRRNNQMKGLVFNIQKFCLHDGPGIRTTIFLKGCALGVQMVLESGITVMAASARHP